MVRPSMEPPMNESVGTSVMGFVVRPFWPGREIVTTTVAVSVNWPSPMV